MLFTRILYSSEFLHCFIDISTCNDCRQQLCQGGFLCEPFSSYLTNQDVDTVHAETLHKKSTISVESLVIIDGSDLNRPFCNLRLVVVFYIYPAKSYNIIIGDICFVNIFGFLWPRCDCSNNTQPMKCPKTIKSSNLVIYMIGNVLDTFSIFIT